MDKLPGEENESDTVINHVMLEELMDTLCGEERELITMRYFHGKTQQEIAEKTFDFPGTGFKDGKENFTPYEKTNSWT